MQVHLPIHEPASVQKVLDVKNTFFFHDQLIVVNGKHGDDSLYANVAFANTCEEAIALQVVKPVDVELTGSKLMEEFPVIAVSENFQCEIEFAVEFFVEVFHQ